MANPLSTHQEQLLTSTAAKALRAIAQARTDIHDQQYSQAETDLHQAQTLIAMVKAARSTARIRPFFAIELSVDDLLHGLNRLNIRCDNESGCTDFLELTFRYDPSPILLPLQVDWKDVDLDVGDGQWETFKDDKIWGLGQREGLKHMTAS
ncbi:MAG: hypothetical protein AB7T38_01560 [Nitrospirales bacterium]